MFAYLSSSPRSLPFVQRVPCKKNSAAKNYEFEEKKTAYFGRGGSSPFSSTQALRPDSRNSEERSRPVRPRFACPSRQVISLKCLRLARLRHTDRIERCPVSGVAVTLIGR